MKKIFRNIAGIILILFGIIGGFIPVLQGWVFVLLGYILLDFKKKEIFEEKIILFLSKRKYTKKLADLWLKVKKHNIKTVNDNDKKIKNIYHEINKDINDKNGE